MNSSILVFGTLNTDIVASGSTNIPGANQLEQASALTIQAGGKSANIARMIATLTNKDTVAMIGRTSQDRYGLWKVPLDALRDDGVNTDQIQIHHEGFPGVALITVDKNGNNAITIAPGESAQFSPADVDKADSLFTGASMVVLSLEMPFETALHILKKAQEHKVKVVLDPGGIRKNAPNHKLFNYPIEVIKPNEQEIEIITGIQVHDFNSSQAAAQKLLDRGVAAVLVTLGKNGADLFTKTDAIHIKTRTVSLSGPTDSTGCGDQTTATLTSQILNNIDLPTAAELAVYSGTLQFHKQGIVPITQTELEN